MKANTFLLAIISTFLTGAIMAQTARIQVIHNSADAAAEVVDVYINDVLTIPDFEFRTATPFVDVPAGVSLDVQIAPGNSMSSAEAIATFNYNLTADETYIIVANGIVSAEGYSPAIGFDLHVYPMAREMAMEEGNTDVLVFHGATDAPIVDVYEAAIAEATIVDDMDYAEFRGYLELPTENYVLHVKDETGSVVVASYDAPLAALELQNQALIVLASGFLNPANNSDGEGFGLYVALPSGGALIPLPQSMARAQVIHNSADAAAETVDVYLNGEMLLDNFMFRTATPFVDVPSGVEIEIAIAGSESMSASEALATFNYSLESGAKYIIVANGIVSAEGYSPAIGFDLHVYPMAREMAMEEGNTDVLVFHGATDAPIVDVYEAAIAEATIVDDMDYAEFRGYLELPTENYVLHVKDETGSVVVASYDAPLAALELQNQALIVLASGFLNPANNSDGEGFGLYVALPSGGALIPLPQSMARAQVIHNSADAAAEMVDVYLNGEMLIDNFMFRSATPFVDVPSGVEIEIAIAGPESMSASEALATFNYSLESGAKYIIVANGIVSAEGYSPAIGFDLHVYPMAREMAMTEGNTDVLVFHGATDAPIVDVYEAAIAEATIVDDMDYAEFRGYLELPTADYMLQVMDESGTNIVASYDAPLASLELEGQALVVLASGFLNPAENSDGEAFGLFVALSDGGSLVQLPLSSPMGIEQYSDLNLSIYPNPVSDVLNISLDNDFGKEVSLSIYNSMGQIVENKSFYNENLISINIESLTSGTYYLILNSDAGTIKKNVQVVR